MKATYNDSIQMDALLLSARAVLAEAAQLDTGRKVRITLCNEENKCMSFVAPARVAAYASRAIGAPGVVQEAGRVVFFSQGVAVAWLPSVAGWNAVLKVCLARLVAESKKAARQAAKLKKGGLAA